MKAAFVMDTAMKTVISTHYFDTFKTGLHIYIYIYIYPYAGTSVIVQTVLNADMTEMTESKKSQITTEIAEYLMVSF